MNIAVAGTGYVGLVTGVALAHIGHHVTCVDIDEIKIKKMQEGISPIYEEGLEELMHLNEERLTYTTDYKKAYSKADVIFIGVGTPEKEDGSANLTYLYAVLDQIRESVTKDTVVVIKSTVPIGTNDEVEKYLNEKVSGLKISIVSNPEFLAQGTAVHDTLYATRIVVGVEDDYAKLAGLTEGEESDESVGLSIKKRIPWLIILLFFQHLLLLNWYQLRFLDYRKNLNKESCY